MDAIQRKSIIREMERISTLMDASIGIPGTKFQFGADALIGLFPGGGDLVGVGVSLYIVARAAQLGVPKWVLTRMLGNVAIDGVVGIVPIAGDVFDAVFKANKKKVALTLKSVQNQAENDT